MLTDKYKQKAIQGIKNASSEDIVKVLQAIGSEQIIENKKKTSDLELTRKIKKALLKRYSMPEWMILFEVQDSTGAKFTRRADAFAINLYPSKQFLRVCFEIKASMQDLKRELEDGTKAESVGKYADRFYLVYPKDRIDPQKLDIPEGWGLLAYDEGKDALKEKRKPISYQRHAVDDGFLASILQSVYRCRIKEMEDHIEDYKKEIQKQLSMEYYQKMQDDREEIKQQLENEHLEDKRVLDNLKRLYGRRYSNMEDNDFIEDMRMALFFRREKDNIKVSIEKMNNIIRNMEEKEKQRRGEGSQLPPPNALSV